MAIDEDFEDDEEELYEADGHGEIDDDVMCIRHRQHGFLSLEEYCDLGSWLLA